MRKIFSIEENTYNLLQLENKLNHLKETILSKAARGELGTNGSTEEGEIELLKNLIQKQT
ncbi:hypothetical protein SM124_13280 [Bacillus sp. 31A1R]|uniref:Uncharacterized protein n=1 Tax=Robertmurraya mangrovi TaxID=3098077 RepID=A0ABU5IZW7_9BACI|nr:hypothetical protein [Bacillus sp. 31A1R]